MSDERYKDPEVLERLYLQRGLTQEEVGNRLGVSQKTISRWLNRHDIEPPHDQGQGKRNDAPYTPATYLTVLDPCGLAYESWHDGRSNKFVKVHRLLAVAEYGFDEVVGKVIHHKNGIPWDNRPENIEPMFRTEHTSMHSKERRS